MSINKILETAGRLGIPVVITNDRGESPQVVMPFEDFAAMVGIPGTTASKPHVHQNGGTETEDEVARALADLTLERMQEHMQDPTGGSSSATKKRVEATDASFLEENFYLEPLEDEKS